MMSALDRLLRPIHRSIRLLCGRAIVNLVNDAGNFQLVQIDRYADETADKVERFGEYGLASYPPAGAEGIVISVGGVRSHAVVVGCEHRQYRLKGLASGEVAIYDNAGQVIKLGAGGITVTTTLPVAINGQSFDVTAGLTTLHGGLKVTGDVEVDGDLLAKGNAKFGAAAVKFVMLADNTPSTKVQAQ